MALMVLLDQYKTAALETLHTNQTHSLQKAELIARAMSHERQADIRMLAKSPEVIKYVNQPSDANRANVVRIFQQFCRAYKQYDQVRMIRFDGQEMIRVNYDHRQCLELEPEHLQNKSDRYYFTASMQLDTHEIFISPMDLNVENGKIEQPNNPTIRFGTPVTDDQGGIQVVIILNYFAEKILDEIVNSASAHHGTKNGYFVYLLNDSGYYLHSNELPENEFGFMFGRQQARFGKHFPGAWQALKDGKDHYHSEANTFLMKAIPVPFSNFPADMDGAGDTATSDYWFLVHRVTDAALYDDLFLVGHHRWALFVPCWLIILLLSNLWADRIWRGNEVTRVGENLQDVIHGLDRARVGLYTADHITGRILGANNGIQKLLGFSEAELTDMYIWDLCSENCESFERLRTDVDEEDPLTYETQYVHRDGHRIPMEVTLSFRSGDNTSTAHYVVMAMDVSQRRKAQLALEEERSRLESILHTASDGIHLFNSEGVLIEANQRFLNMIGWDEEAIGKLHLIDWGVFFNKQEAIELVQQLLDSNEQVMLNTRHRHADGHVFDVEISAIPMTIGGERVIYAASRNTSKRIQAERENEQLLRDMGKRVNELACMYGIAEIAHRSDCLNEILQATANILPSGFQYPDDAHTRVTLDNRSFIDDNFVASEWYLTSNLVIDGQRRGSVEVFYSEPHLELDEGPFQRQERALIDAAAIALSETTTRKEAQVTLDRYLHIIDEYVIVSSLDLTGRITAASGALCKISGYSREELIGTLDSIVKRPENPNPIHEHLWRTIQHSESWSGEIVNRAKDGSEYWTEINIAPVKGANGERVGYTAIRHDISDKKEIEKISVTDPLTKIANRLKVEEVLHKEIQRSQRYGHQLSIILIDIDYFKNINDTYGHLVGDTVLVSIAQLLSANIRSTDVVGRWGGEEFMLICPEADASGVAILSEKLRASIANHEFPTEKSVTASVGVAMYQSTETAIELIKYADDALYRAKASGRNRVEIAPPHA